MPSYGLPGAEEAFPSLLEDKQDGHEWGKSDRALRKMREDKDGCNYLVSESKDGARLFSEVQGGMTGDNSTCCDMGYSNQALTKISPP